MTVASPRIFAALLPILAAVLIAFLVTGLAMPVLPLHVHEGLGLGTPCIHEGALSRVGAVLCAAGIAVRLLSMPGGVAVPVRSK